MDRLATPAADSAGRPDNPGPGTPGTLVEAGPQDVAPTILFLLPWGPDHIGGVNEVVVNLYRALAARTALRPALVVNAWPHRTMAAAASREIGTHHEFYFPAPVGDGRPWRSLSGFALRLPGVVVRLARELRERKVQAVNAHYPSLYLVNVLLARRLAGRPVRVVLSFHGSDLLAAQASRGLARRLWRLLIRDCDAVVACSHALARDIEATFGPLGARLAVIHNGVDVPGCRTLAAAADRPAALRGMPYIASVGTFEHKKGHDVLIDAFGRLAGEFPDLRLAIAGRSGPSLADTRRRVDAAGLGERIHLFPDLDHGQALALTAGARLFALPSRAEPFGIVILEAGAFGVPVVASAAGGVAEILSEAGSGTLVPPGDSAALAAAMRSSLVQPDLARARGARLAEIVASRFTWSRAVASYEGVLAPAARREA